MRRILLLFILSFSLVGISFQDTGSPKDQNTSVYICDSPGGKKYHYKKDCRGLNACKARIKKVTISEAKKEGKKELCGWED